MSQTQEKEQKTCGCMEGRKPMLQEQTENETARVIYPDASELDTSDHSHSSGYCTSVYLIPSPESSKGVPTVIVFGDHNQHSQPMAAYHCKWTLLFSIPNQTVGESVLAALRAREETIVAMSDMYLGSVWDGNNYVGQWQRGAHEYDFPLYDLSRREFGDITAEFSQYSEEDEDME